MDKQALISTTTTMGRAAWDVLYEWQKDNLTEDEFLGSQIWTIAGDNSTLTLTFCNKEAKAELDKGYELGISEKLKKYKQHLLAGGKEFDAVRSKLPGVETVIEDTFYSTTEGN